MSRTYKRDRDGRYQLTDFAARLDRTKYGEKPTPNRRNQRHESSDFSPARHKGAGPDGDIPRHFFSVKDEAKASFMEALGSLAEGFQIISGRTRNMHFMPRWRPVKLAGTVRVSRLPSRSEFVSPKERQLAKIAVLLENGRASKQNRLTPVPLRTVASICATSPRTIARFGENTTPQ